MYHPTGRACEDAPPAAAGRKNAPPAAGCKNAPPGAASCKNVPPGAAWRNNGVGGGALQLVPSPTGGCAMLRGMSIILHLAILTGTVLLLARFLPGVQIKRTRTAVLVAVVFSVLNVLVGWLINLLLGAVLLVPAILTLGLAWVLVPLVANAVLLWITDELLEAFELRDFRTLLIASGAITAANALFHLLLMRH
jgi:putative membrane protein